VVSSVTLLAYILTPGKPLDEDARKRRLFVDFSRLNVLDYYWFVPTGFSKGPILTKIAIKKGCHMYKKKEGRLLRQSGESRQVFVLFAIQYAVAPCQKGTD
jgi:hypothetical protein